MSTYDLKFVADVTGTAAGLAKIPGMTEKASAMSALKQVTAQRKAAAEQEKIQKEAAKKAADGWSNAFKGVAKVAGFGDLTEKAGALSGGMEGAAMASGLAVAGVAAVAASAVGAAVGVMKLVDAAGAAIERMDRLGVTDIITATQREQVIAANDAMDALGVGVDAVTVSLAANLAPVLTDVATRIVSLELFVSKTIAAFDVGLISFGSWRDILKAVTIGGLLPFVDGLLTVHRMLGTNTDAMEGFVAGLHKSGAEAASAAIVVASELTPAMKAVAVLSTDGAKLTTQVAEANRKGTEAYKKHAEAVKELAKAEKERNEETELARIEAMSESWGALYKSLIKGDEEVAAAHFRVQDAIAAADDAEMAAFHTRIKDRKKAKEEEHAADVEGVMSATSSMIDAIGSVASAWQDAHMARLTQLQDELKEVQRTAKLAAKAGQASEAIIAESHAMGIERRIRAEKRMIIAAFVAKQSAAVAAIGMDTAVAVMKALAELGPVAGGVATGLIIGTGAIQAGLVLAQKPPKFARGGVVGIEAEEGEGIANKRAMADPSFRQALDDANEGRGGSGRGGDATNVFLNDRLLMVMYGRMRRLSGQAIPPRLAREM